MRKGDKSFLGILSFIVLIVVAFLLLVRWLAPILTLNPIVCNILETVQNLMVLVVIGMLAYNFASSYNRWVKVLFWIASAIFLVGIVLSWL